MRDDLRAAVELALAVGRADHDADSPVPPPPALRPFFTFAKLPSAAQKTAVAVIDSDEPFRTRVAAKATERSVGRVGWLWLHRPDGWEQELDSIRRAAQADQRRRDDDRDEQRAVRRLRKVEDRAGKAEQIAEVLRSELETDRAALVSMRAERDASLRLIAELEAQVEQSADERSRILGQFKASEARAAALLDEKRTIEGRVQRLEDDIVEVRASAEFGAALSGGERGAPRPTPPEPEFDDIEDCQQPNERQDPARFAALADALADAATVAQQLAGSLADAADGVMPATMASIDRAGSDSNSGSGRSRRKPESLPVGVFDDSVEAANHLVRVPNMVALVDGYNVSMGAWPHLSITDQRRRLIDGLDALSARTRLTVELVFDGIRDPDAVVSHRGPRLMNVHYTELGVEADDLILDRIGGYSETQPVMVVSSDRRVGDGARERGANVLESTLLAQLISGA